MTDPLAEARRQGALEERVTEHDRRLAAINGSIDRAEQAISNLSTQVGNLGVRVGLYAALGAAAASAVVGIAASLVVYWATK